MNISNTITKAIFDFYHAAGVLFLGFTSWAALQAGLESQFGAFVSIFLLLLINSIFDLGPFAVGSAASDQLGKGKSWKKVLPLIIFALILHGVSATITYLGSDIAAKFIIPQEKIQAENERADEAAKSISLENQRRRERYEDAITAERERRDKLISTQAATLEKQVAALGNQSWAVRDSSNNRERVRISRQVQKLQDDHEKWKAKILNAPMEIKEPDYLPEKSETADGARKLATDLEEQQDKIALALKVTDIALYVSMMLWFVVIVMVPELRGPSTILNLFGVVPYLFRGVGIGIAKGVEYIEGRIEGARTPREKRLLSEVETLSHQGNVLQGKIDDLRAGRKTLENDIQVLSAKLESAQERAEILLTQSEERNRELSGERAEKIRAQNSLQKRNTRVETLTQQVEVLTQRLNALTQQLSDERAEHQKTRSTLELMQRAPRVEKPDTRANEEESGVSESDPEREFERLSKDERVTLYRKSILDKPVEWKEEGKTYASLRSFEGTMRKANSDGRMEVYLKMLRFHNKLLGVGANLRKLG